MLVLIFILGSILLRFRKFTVDPSQSWLYTMEEAPDLYCKYCDTHFGDRPGMANNICNFQKHVNSCRVKFDLQKKSKQEK